MTAKTIEDLERVASDYEINKYPAQRGNDPYYTVDAWTDKGTAMKGVAPTLSAAIEQAIGEGEET